jgi:hypothetical protein
MKLLALVITLLLIQSAFAGYDTSSTRICADGKYKLTIKREGSFFGKNWITLEEDKFFGQKIISETYDQDWSPDGDTAVEKLVKKELPCSNSDFYQLLKSENSVTIESYTSGNTCLGKGERSRIYVQLKKTNAILKFDVETQCKSKEGL